MKILAIRSIFFSALLTCSALFFYGCGDSATSSSGSIPSTSSSSPTQAYQDLFEAVKSGNMDKIQSHMSLRTRDLAKMTAARYQQPVEKVLASAFTTTVKAETLPTARDERIVESMGAVEVWDTESSSWQDVPFIYEDGGWKLAFGDLLAGNWKSPGDSRATRERKESNTSLPSPIENVKPMPSMPEALKKMEQSNANVATNSATANANATSSNSNK